MMRTFPCKWDQSGFYDDFAGFFKFNGLYSNSNLEVNDNGYKIRNKMNCLFMHMGSKKFDLILPLTITVLVVLKRF